MTEDNDLVKCPKCDYLGASNHAVKIHMGMKHGS